MQQHHVLALPAMAEEVSKSFYHDPGRYLFPRAKDQLDENLNHPDDAKMP